MHPITGLSEGGVDSGELEAAHVSSLSSRRFTKFGEASEVGLLLILIVVEEAAGDASGPSRGDGTAGEKASISVAEAADDRRIAAPPNLLASTSAGGLGNVVQGAARRRAE